MKDAINPYPSFDGNNYQIAWRPGDVGTPGVKAGPWPDETGWLNHGDWPLTSGCCYSAFQQWDDPQQAKALLALAFQIVCDGVPVDDVLREFSKIRVWREMGVLLPAGFFEKAFLTGRWMWSPHTP